MYVYHVYAVPTEAKRGQSTSGTGVADGVSTENEAHVLCKRSTQANSLSIPVAIVATTCKKAIIQQSHSSVILSLLYKTFIFLSPDGLPF